MEKNIKMGLNDGGFVFETCQYQQSKVATVIMNSLSKKNRDYFLGSCTFAIPIDVTLTEKRKGEVGATTPKAYEMLVVGTGMPATISYKDGRLSIDIKSDQYNWERASIKFGRSADQEKWQRDYKEEAIEEIFSKIIEEVSKDRTWTKEGNFKASSAKRVQQNLAKTGTLNEVQKAFRDFNRRTLREDKVVNHQNHVIALNFTTDANGKIQRDDNAYKEPVINDSYARHLSKSLNEAFEAVYKSDLNNFREDYDEDYAALPRDEDGYLDDTNGEIDAFEERYKNPEDQDFDFYTGEYHVPGDEENYYDRLEVSRSKKAPSGDYPEYADYDIYDIYEDCDKEEIQDLQHAEWNKELEDEYYNDDNLYQDRLVDQYRESLTLGADVIHVPGDEENYYDEIEVNRSRHIPSGDYAEYADYDPMYDDEVPPDCDESDADIATKFLGEDYEDNY